MNKWTKIAVLCVGLILPLSGLQAAPEKDPVPTQLDGDVITYISKTGVMTAQGGVKLTQGTAVLTGDIGEYNTKTKEAVVTGNVKVVKEGSTLTAAEVRAYDEMKRLVATGNALLVHQDGTAAGPYMEYLPDKKYAKITGTSKATATRDLTDLLAKDLLRVEGVGKATRYAVNVPGWHQPEIKP